MAPGDIVPALVERRRRRRHRARRRAALRIGTLHGRARPARASSGRGGTHAAEVVTRRRSRSRSSSLTVDATSGTATVTLEQTPLLEGALVAIDNRTGQVLAMVGGFSFARSKFNRATQALPAARLDLQADPLHRRDRSRADAGDDARSTRRRRSTPAPASRRTRPRNYDGKFEGPVTLRRALEHSRNIPAVRVMEMLGPRQVVAYAKRFGFPEDFPPYPVDGARRRPRRRCSKLTQRLLAFPEPGHPAAAVPGHCRSPIARAMLLEEHRPVPRDAIRADTAFVMTNLLRGVVQRGTAGRGGRARLAAGRQDRHGRRLHRRLVRRLRSRTSRSACGSATTRRSRSATARPAPSTALPIWIDFMKAYIEARGDRTNPPAFEPPGNIVFIAVDRDTGEPVGDDGAGDHRSLHLRHAADKPAAAAASRSGRYVGRSRPRR